MSARQPFPAISVKCANPKCPEMVTPENPREGTVWAGMEFAPRTMCPACDEAAALYVRGLIAAIHEADDEARQNAA